MPVMTGLSGNEMYCLQLKGFSAGELVIGNSVYSMGLLGSLGAAGRGLLGGEVSQVTAVIRDGREQAYQRLVKEAARLGGVGISGVTSELRSFHNNTEFLSVASTLHRKDEQSAGTMFTTSANGQELFCQIDAGFTPIKFAFGNVAYSVGAAGGIIGSLKAMARGEIKEFSDVFNRTRHLALERICRDAAEAGANAVVGIETRTMRFSGVHEMLMMGTASHHEGFDLPISARPSVGGGAIGYQPRETAQAEKVFPMQPISSDLTNEEMWNVIKMGLMPLKLVLGTAVYSLGIVGGIKAAFASLARGEIDPLTSLIYDAREHAIGLIRDEANAIGADDVVGVTTHVHEHGSLLEFMAVGTAVRRVDGLETASEQLPPQAVIRDKDTWVSSDHGSITLRKAGR